MPVIKQTFTLLLAALKAREIVSVSYDGRIVIVGSSIFRINKHFYTLEFAGGCNLSSQNLFKVS